LEDQYFGTPSVRALNLIHDFEIAMWKLGIPIQTRHREVAPGQYEIAPRFNESNISSDQNMLLMEILRRTALKHGMAVLLHEKPFAGVNGSGKHNNWSFGTNKVPSLLAPGDTPSNNIKFMLFLAATLRAVDLHADLLRVAISGAGNDHRLGANEAPPAIVSAYLGDDIERAVEHFVSGAKGLPAPVELKVDLRIPFLPPLERGGTDRNRTSSFAFTGNKFEFRAVGSSHNPSRSNTVLNTIFADSLRVLSAEIKELKLKGMPTDDAIAAIARRHLLAHKRVIFNGNGYSKEWPIEAARRGLPNLRTTPDALEGYASEKNVKLFESLGKQIFDSPIIII
jgi:glutamine synthetase